MQINLTNIFSQENVVKKLKKEILVDSIQFGNQKFQVQDDIQLELEVKKISENEILLEGNIQTTLILSCDRCNVPVKYDLNANISKEVRIDHINEEDYYIEGYHLNLEEFALNEIYVNFPMKVLCKEDCKSVCKKCGVNLNLQSCNCILEDIDPRLEGLKTLFNDNFKEV